jgi:hypothetical protein
MAVLDVDLIYRDIDVIDGSGPSGENFSTVYELRFRLLVCTGGVNGGETFNTDNHRWSQSFKKRYSLKG